MAIIQKTFHCLALLIVDVQEAMITGSMYREREVLDNMVRLLNEARAAGALIIFVRHDYGEGHDWAKGTPGWEIWHEIAPRVGEEIVDKDRSSAFRGTKLSSMLFKRGVKDLVVIGVHTEYCVNATILGASERGYNVIVPEMANTTHGNEYMDAPILHEYYNRKMWNGRYATVQSVDEVVEQIRTWGEKNGREASANNL